jgi:hypothetical protein
LVEGGDLGGREAEKCRGFEVERWEGSLFTGGIEVGDCIAGLGGLRVVGTVLALRKMLGEG